MTTLITKSIPATAAILKTKCPLAPDSTVLTLDAIKETPGGWLGERKIMSGKPTLKESYTTDKSYSVCKVDVSGYKRVRFPSVPTGLIGSIFTDTDGNVLKSIVVPTIGLRFEAGMYLISDIPERATALHFSILNTAEFDCVVLSNSDKIEDMSLIGSLTMSICVPLWAVQ